MESQSNSTDKNNPSNSTTSSFSIGGSLTVGANLVTGGNFGDHANFSYTSTNYSQSNQPIPLTPINNTNQPVEEDNLQESTPTGNYCCVAGGLEIGCGTIPLPCCNLEPSLKFASLMCCCWRNNEQILVQQTNNDNQQFQQENISQQPQPTAQMENTGQQDNQQGQQSQIQIPPK